MNSGAQGTRKTSFLRQLGGACGRDHYARASLGDLGGKDLDMLVAQGWIIDIDELQGLRKADGEKLKAFVTATHANVRPPYGRRLVVLPRFGVIAATTNQGSDRPYLQDASGARRFRPIEVSKTIPTLGQARLDAILSAARDAYLADATPAKESAWRLSPEAETELAILHRERDVSEHDTWIPEIKKYLERHTEVLMSDVLTLALTIPVERQTAVLGQRAGQCMRILGWTRSRPRAGDGTRHTKWVAPEGWQTARSAPVLLHPVGRAN